MREGDRRKGLNTLRHHQIHTVTQTTCIHACTRAHRCGRRGVKSCWAAAHFVELCSSVRFWQQLVKVSRPAIFQSTSLNIIQLSKHCTTSMFDLSQSPLRRKWSPLNATMFFSDPKLAKHYSLFEQNQRPGRYCPKT